VAASLAKVARLQGFTRPALAAEPVLQVQGGWHPVVVAAAASAAAGGGGSGFVRNDCVMGADARHWLITGPNMGGKSTFLRQNALVVLLAQMGSFVPAQAAVVGVTDAVFARVGAGDNLAANQSTFLVEMAETAHILHNATPRSFVVLDEVGRGTSPEDGLALAAAIADHLARTTQCRTLAATHLLQLPRVLAACPGVVNYHVDASTSSSAGGIVFSHRLLPGAAVSSHGLAVARLAGILPSVVDAAAAFVLQQQQQQEQQYGETPPPPPPPVALAPAEHGLLALYRGWVASVSPPPPPSATPGQLLRLMFHYAHGK
jgi:DNA mismatch repair protein MutS